MLGSDSLRHNLTVLRFFNDKLTAICPPVQTRRFMVVALDSAPFSGFGQLDSFGQLDIESVDSKKAMTKALVRRDAVAPDERYFLHDQFNLLLWLAMAMLAGKSRPARISWHLWERICMRNCAARATSCSICCTAAPRDGSVMYSQPAAIWPVIASGIRQCRLLCSNSPPTQLATDIRRMTPLEAGNRPLTLMVGNSGDPSNQHCQTLRAIHHQFGTGVRIIVLMGYPSGDDAYIATVRAEGEHFFPDRQVRILTEQLAFNDHLALLLGCDAGYFLFQRQRGVGTLSLLIQLGLPFVLSRHNPFCQDLVARQVPVLYEDDPLDPALIRETQ